MPLSFLSTRRALCALPLCLGLSLAACGDDDKSTDDGQTDQTGPTGKVDAGGLDGSVPDGSARDGAATPDASAPANAALDGLAGRYLMRWDTVGTASSEFASVQVQIRSRLSTLLVAELKVTDGKLTSVERVCTQTAAQTCSKNCDGASTVIDPRVISDFLPTRQQSREFTLSADGTFTAGRSVAQLGYDDPNPDAAEPTAPDDPRIWDVIPGGDREGFLSKVTVSAFGIPFECQTYGTQKFVTSFAGKLGGSVSAPQIPQMELDLGDSNALVLGSDNPACASQKVDVPVDIKNARMVRYGDALAEDAFWKCPEPSVFDAMLPGTPL
jgi:hypothetical protein